MKVVKLNGRYHGYPKWRYMLDFGPVRRRIWKADRPRRDTAELFEKLYGKDEEYVPGLGEYYWTSFKLNENWANDQKRNRIYFNNEADITAIMLLKSF